ncbi:MAG: hypothetical protein WCI41_01180 [bacterium]
MKFNNPEHSFKHEYHAGPQIETIKTPENNEVSFSPDRGGMITHLKFNGKDILYFNEINFKNINENVRGGIPILFPNTGPIEGPKYPNLKPHGFARDSKFPVHDEINNGFVEILESNKETREIFPYDFYLKMKANFEKDGSFKIVQSVKNLGGGKDLPIAMGLHPYFNIPSKANEDVFELKKKIKFNFKGGEEVAEKIDEWANSKYISIDNTGKPMEIDIPNLGTIILEFSKEYKKIWIWSNKGDNYICIEPVMRDSNGLVNDPEKIKPGNTFSGTTIIKMKE